LHATTNTFNTAMKISTLLISVCVWALPHATLAFAPTSRRNTHTSQPLALSLCALGDFDTANNLITNSAALSSSIDLSSAGILTTENIKQAFSVATFFPQIWWLFLIVLPKSGITKKLMGGYEILTITSLVHFFIVAASIAQPDGTAPMAEFADVFDPAGDPQKAMVGMMQYPNFVSEEWSHVLTWDLFVGRWIWLDGLKRGIFTSHSVLLCNLIGPPGLLLHWATCLVTGKGLPGNEAEAIDELDE